MCNVFNPLLEDAKRGSGFQNGKEKIKKFFQENQNIKERAEFLKNAYGTGGFGAIRREPNIVTGGNYSAKGIEVEYNDENCRRVNQPYKWKEVAEIITMSFLWRRSNS